MNHSIPSIEWVNTRRVKITKLSFDSTVNGVFPDKFWENLGNHVLPLLTTLELSNANVKSINDDLATIIATFCHRLEHIYISGCPFITIPGYQLIFGHCTKLHTLDGNFSNDRNDASVRRAGNLPVQRVLGANRLLAGLRQHNTCMRHINIFCHTLCGETLREAISYLPSLERLRVDCDWEDGDMHTIRNWTLQPLVQTIVDHCPRLEELSLGGCGRNPKGHQESPALRKLLCKSLRFSDCWLHANDLIHVSFISRLENLIMRQFDGPASADSFLHAVHLGGKANEQRLRTLTLDAFTFYDDDDDDDEEGKVTIFQNLRNYSWGVALETLHLIDSVGINDDCLFLIARQCPLLCSLTLVLNRREYTIRGLVDVVTTCLRLHLFRIQQLGESELETIRQQAGTEVTEKKKFGPPLCAFRSYEIPARLPFVAHRAGPPVEILMDDNATLEREDALVYDDESIPDEDDVVSILEDALDDESDDDVTKIIELGDMQTSVGGHKLPVGEENDSIVTVPQYEHESLV